MLAPGRVLPILVLSLVPGLAGCWPERTFEEAPRGEEEAEAPRPSAEDLSGDGAREAGDSGGGTDPADDDHEPRGDTGDESDAGATDEPDVGPEDAGAPPGPPLLDQVGNPIYQQLSTYASLLSTAPTAEERLAADLELADNVLSWQLPHGGFYKNDKSVYAVAWNGTARRSEWTGSGGVELGTIDNNATVSELLFLADVYQRAGEERHREGARKAFDFLLGMQLPSGGFPQAYPERPDSYSNHVTFNDDAMARVLVSFLHAVNRGTPLDGDVLTEEQQSTARQAIDRAVEYILAAQLEHDGKKTVWCAQHDPVTYEPRGARSYELPSKSGKESVGIASFLMTQPQTPEIEAAVKAAVAWYRSDTAQIEDTVYISRPSSSTDDSYNPIQPQPGGVMWCRFYELEEDVCFFSGRLPTDDPPGTGKQYDIMDIEPERRYGYTWGGSFGAPLLNYADRVGY